MPAMVNTPEMRFQVDESRKFAVVEEVLERLGRDGAKVDRTDGARVNTDDGWWLLRASNTQDVLVARAEAKDEAGLERLIAQIDEQLALSGLTRGPQVEPLSAEDLSRGPALLHPLGGARTVGLRLPRLEGRPGPVDRPVPDHHAGERTHPVADRKFRGSSAECAGRSSRSRR